MGITNDTNAGAWFTGPDPETGTPETGTGNSPAAAETGTETGSGTPEKKKPLGSDILAPKEVKIEVPGDPTEPPQPKPAKKKSSGGSKKAADQESLNLLVSGVLQSVFAIAASRDPVWIVSEAEVNSIAEPAGRIIAKLDKSGELGKYSDGIALLVAAGAVVGSRVIVIKNRGRKKQNGELKQFNKAANPASDKRNDPPAAAAADAGYNFSDLMPAVG